MPTKEFILREKKNKLTWEIDPTLEDAEKLQHQKHDDIQYILGTNDEGKRHLKSVDYSLDYGFNNIIDKISSRSRKETCADCDDNNNFIFPLVERPSLIGTLRERLLSTKKEET